MKCYPTALTDDGRVVGEFFDSANKRHAFLRDAAGRFTVIDYPGAAESDFAGINAAGQISGFYADKTYNRHGFVREPDGSFTTISPPGAVPDIEAHGIGPAGQVLGSFIGQDGPQHKFLAVPVK